MTTSRFFLVMPKLSLTEPYAVQRLWIDMIGRMSALGFAVRLIEPRFIDPPSGRTLQVNGLFSRGKST